MIRTFIEMPIFTKRWKEIYLITAFEKKEQENLTMEEKNAIKKLVKALKEEISKNRRSV
jgi:hypothetical protein